MGFSCICNLTCYGYVACSCNNTCYGYSCSCNNRCYGYSACSCNNTCYRHSCSCYNRCYGDAGWGCTYKCYISCYVFSCSCNNTCYRYSACSCNNTCYSYSSCSCNNTCYGYQACTTCDNVVYGKQTMQNQCSTGTFTLKNSFIKSLINSVTSYFGSWVRNLNTFRTTIVYTADVVGKTLPNLVLSASTYIYSAVAKIHIVRIIDIVDATVVSLLEQFSKAITNQVDLIISLAFTTKKYVETTAYGLSSMAKYIFPSTIMSYITTTSSLVNRPLLRIYSSTLSLSTSMTGSISSLIKEWLSKIRKINFIFRWRKDQKDLSQWSTSRVNETEWERNLPK